MSWDGLANYRYILEEPDLGTTVPALVFLLVVAYLPIAYAVMLSFFKKTAFRIHVRLAGWMLAMPNIKGMKSDAIVDEAAAQVRKKMKRAS